MKGKTVHMKFKIGQTYNKIAQSRAFTFISANLKTSLEEKKTQPKKLSNSKDGSLEWKARIYHDNLIRNR